MVVSSLLAPDGRAAREDLSVYLQDLGFELAQMSLSAGAPDAALHFLQAVAALRRRAQVDPENAAPGDAA